MSDQEAGHLAPPPRGAGPASLRGSTSAGSPSVDARSRPSIEERARRREALTAAGRDRYVALVRSLQAGRELPFSRPARRRIRLTIHPSAWTAVKVVLLCVGLYAIALGVEAWTRERAVDTWQGPDSAVTSGQTLAGCPGASQISNDTFPSWIRVSGTVYLLTDRQRPFVGIGRTNGFSDSGYRHGALRLLFIDDNERGRAREDIFVWQEPAIAGVTYARDSTCH